VSRRLHLIPRRVYTRTRSRRDVRGERVGDARVGFEGGPLRRGRQPRSCDESLFGLRTTDEHRHALDHPEARAIKTASIRSEEVRIDFFATVGAGSNLGEDGLVTARAGDP